MKYARRKLYFFNHNRIIYMRRHWTWILCEPIFLCKTQDFTQLSISSIFTYHQTLSMTIINLISFTVWLLRLTYWMKGILFYWVTYTNHWIYTAMNTAMYHYPCLPITIPSSIDLYLMTVNYKEEINFLHEFLASCPLANQVDINM